MSEMEICSEISDSNLKLKSDLNLKSKKKFRSIRLPERRNTTAINFGVNTLRRLNSSSENKNTKSPPSKQGMIVLTHIYIISSKNNLNNSMSQIIPWIIDG